MRIFLHLLIGAFLIHGYPSCALAENPREKVNGKKIDSTAVLQSATANFTFLTPVAEFVGVTITKTGTGKGTGKLQGTFDGTNWVDVAGSTATAAVAAGSSSSTVYSTANPFPTVRYNFVEDGTGAVTITTGSWISK